MKLSTKLCVLALLIASVPLLMSTQKAYAVQFGNGSCRSTCAYEQQLLLDGCASDNGKPSEYGQCKAVATGIYNQCIAQCPS